MPTTKPKPKQVKRLAKKWFVETKPKVQFTKVLSQFPNVDKKEIALIKHGGAYTDISINRRKEVVTPEDYTSFFLRKSNPNDFKKEKILEKSGKFVKRLNAKEEPISIHTHPMSDGVAFLMYNDIKMAIYNYFKSASSMKQNVSIELDKNGNQIGRTFFNVTKETALAAIEMRGKNTDISFMNFLLKQIDLKYEEINLRFTQKYYGLFKKAKLKKDRDRILDQCNYEINSRLQRYFIDVLKIRFKFQAMPGYRYNNELMRFEKIK